MLRPDWRNAGRPEKIAVRFVQGPSSVYIHSNPSALVSLIAGILILVFPRLLNFIVAIYLIVVGVMGLTGSGYWR
jgi:hypothetical protein